MTPVLVFIIFLDDIGGVERGFLLHRKLSISHKDHAQLCALRAQIHGFRRPISANNKRNARKKRQEELVDVTGSLTDTYLFVLFSSYSLYISRNKTFSIFFLYFSSTSNPNAFYLWSSNRLFLVTKTMFVTL